MTIVSQIGKMLRDFQELADKAANRFRCDICFRVLGSARSLSRHKKGHAGQTSFPCQHEGCNQVFDSTNALYGHMFNVHGSLPKTFVCKVPDCGQR